MAKKNTKSAADKAADNQEEKVVTNTENKEPINEKDVNPETLLADAQTKAEEIISNAIESAQIKAEEIISKAKDKVDIKLGSKKEKHKVNHAEKLREKARQPKKDLYFEYKGQKYGFKSETPENLKVAGKVISLKELVEDGDLMEELIRGNNYFITLIPK